MTYTPPEGVTIGTFTTDTLPASFRAPADVGISYKIHGTAAGTGVVTDNLWDAQSASLTYRQVADTGSMRWAFIITEPGTYSLKCFNDNIGYVYCRTYKASTDKYGQLYRLSVPAQSTDHIQTVILEVDSDVVIVIYTRDDRTADDAAALFNLSKLCIVSGAILPTSYIPSGYQIPLTVETIEQTQNLIVYIGDSQLSETEYVDYESGKIYKLQESELTPTDPPASLPAITASGETTITTTETLGDIELTGEWTAIMGSTVDESIDIGITVDADEYIAFVTVDDNPSIQVSDTITMPSSAGSFTLQVVSWGRELYTETVYNALS